MIGAARAEKHALRGESGADELIDHARHGRVRLAEVMPPAEAAAAHRLSEGGRVTGKIALRP